MLLSGLKNLFELDLTDTPLSQQPDYRENVFKIFPQLGVSLFLLNSSKYLVYWLDITVLLGS